MMKKEWSNPSLTKLNANETKNGVCSVSTKHDTGSLYECFYYCKSCGGCKVKEVQATCPHNANQSIPLCDCKSVALS